MMPGMGGGLALPLFVIIISMVFSVFSRRLLFSAHSLTWFSSAAMVDLVEAPIIRYELSANFDELFPWFRGWRYEELMSYTVGPMPDP